MDEVQFNDRGNEITLIKRRAELILRRRRLGERLLMNETRRAALLIGSFVGRRVRRRIAGHRCRLWRAEPLCAGASRLRCCCPAVGWPADGRASVALLPRSCWSWPWRPDRRRWLPLVLNRAVDLGGDLAASSGSGGTSPDRACWPPTAASGSRPQQTPVLEQSRRSSAGDRQRQQVEQSWDRSRSSCSRRSPSGSGPSTVGTGRNSCSRRSRSGSGSSSPGHAEAQFASLVDSLSLHLIRKDRHGRFTVRQPVVLQADRQEAGGDPRQDRLRSVSPRPWPRSTARDDQRVLTTKQKFEDVEVHPRPGGGKMHVQVMKMPILDDGEGKPSASRVCSGT